MAQVEMRISASEGRRKDVDYEAAQVLYERARGNRDLVVADGSLGVHNMAYVEQLLGSAEEDCRRALAVLEGKRAASVP